MLTRGRLTRAGAGVLPAALVTLAACVPALVPAPTTVPASRPAPTRAPAPTPAPTPDAAPARPAAPAEPALASSAAAESLLVDVARVDTTLRVELRYATPYNFTGAVLPGYDAPRALLRREAAEALGRVQARLRAAGVGLKLFDAYRPVRASDAMITWTRRANREDLVRDGYVVERDDHNLAAAVDVTLVDLATDRELKMGTAFDTFAPGARTANAAGAAAANRERLRRAMEAEGFAGVAAEWWHFRYEVPGAVRFDVPIR